MKKLFLYAMSLLALSACNYSEPGQHNSERQKYLVEEITWYESNENHAEAYYEYDNNNRLIQRIINNTYFEQGKVKHRTYTDTYEYTNGYLTKISDVVEPADQFWHPDKLFYYDNNGKLIKYEYGNNIIHFGYHNNLMDSVWFESDPNYYILLEYDSHGNITKERIHQPELDITGQRTGNYYFVENTYQYDTHPRPNFNIDNAFMYDPVFGQGDAYLTCARMISPNNLIRYSNGPETWEYEYNEQGLPIEMYQQYADIVPTNHPTFKFTYRKIE